VCSNGHTLSFLKKGNGGEMRANFLSQLSVKVLERLAEDDGFLEDFKENFDYSEIDLKRFGDDEEVANAVRKLIIAVIDKIDFEDDSVVSDVSDNFDFDSCVKEMCLKDDAVIQELGNTLRQLIIKYLNQLDIDDDESLKDTIIENVDNWFENKIKDFLSQDTEIQAAMADKLRHLVMERVVEFDENNFDNDLDQAIISAMSNEEFVQKVIIADDMPQQELKEKLQQVVISWFGNVERNQDKIIEIISDSPPLLHLLDKVIAEMLKEPQYEELFKKAVQNTLSDPELFQQVVADGLKQLMSREKEEAT